MVGQASFVNYSFFKSVEKSCLACVKLLLQHMADCILYSRFPFAKEYFKHTQCLAQVPQGTEQPGNISCVLEASCSRSEVIVLIVTAVLPEIRTSVFL